ncbi:testis anion transporter 1 isoform X2 [Tyto alba]|uniref:testis anion transporter 1 isoform X2 n=1 Tax=Tyto alba TaxID=56313 RepID=UPI001C67F1CC|nr:testis anion transporter 1 isoform X2 [Tyto alba]
MQTEEHFQAYFERKLSSTLGGVVQIQRENRRLQCSFSWGRFGKIILKVFPVLNWLLSYRFREWILRDLHAGLSVGMFQIPQGFLGVWLTRLPLPSINGFLSAFCCSMTYVMFGTSHHISIGSFSILNMVVADILKTLTFNQTFSFNGSLDNISDPKLTKDYMEALTLTASVTFLTGVIQLLLGCFCLGFVTSYVPKTLIDAYLTAAALHVIVSQFSFIFDVVLDFHKGPLGIFYNLFRFLLVLPKANATSILLFLLSMAMLRVNTCIMITYKHSPIAFPMELLLIITVVIISNCIHLHAESSSAVVSMIPQRFVPPTSPDLSNLSKIILHAFSLALVSYFLLVFAGERYASLHNYNIASNQELVAVGLCNICSSFFKSFVVSCAISGTVIQEKTGGRTQLAAVIGASMMLMISLKLGRFFQMIPNGILAAIVVFNMIPFLEKFLDVPILWRQDKYHFVIWLVTFAAVLCFGLDVGLVIAMGSAFFIITIRSHRMKMVVLGQIPNMNIYRSLSVYRAIPYTEKLVKRHHTGSRSSSSVNLVHWSKYGDKLSSRMLWVGPADAQCASPGSNEGLTTEKNKDEGRRACLSLGSAVDDSSVQLDQEEQPMRLPCPVHTIILDFSMVQFVDLLGSVLLQQIIHMFHNTGITVLIAGCHSSVIADFEKNGFFDSCVTKERFFLTLHDAVLSALGNHQNPAELEPTAQGFAEESLAEQQKGRRLYLKKNEDFFSVKNSDNELLHEEPISDVSRSAQNKAEPSSLQQCDAPPLRSDFQDPGWGKRWKYTSNP